MKNFHSHRPTRPYALTALGIMSLLALASCSLDPIPPLDTNEVSTKPVPPQNAMDIGKIDNATSRVTVYRQPHTKPIPMTDCVDKNTCFVIPANGSSYAIETVKKTGVSACGKPYEVYISKMAVASPEGILNRLDAITNPALHKDIAGITRLMDVNYKYTPMKGIANSVYFLQPKFGLYQQDADKIDADYQVLVKSMDKTTLEAIIVDALKFEEMDVNGQPNKADFTTRYKLIKGAFPAGYKPSVPYDKLLVNNQLYDGSTDFDGVAIDIRGGVERLDSFEGIDSGDWHMPLYQDDKLRAAFSCVDGVADTAS